MDGPGWLDMGVRLVGASGHPETAQRLSESWGSINRKVPAWGSLSWHFDILSILVSLSKHLSLISILDPSSKWDWEWFLVHLPEWLHLVALGDHCGCGVLVTLGGCRHLDGLEQRRSYGKSWWLFLATSRWLWGVLVSSQRSAKGNSSGLCVSLSYLTCG
jgi:hypothetical protein